MRAIDLDWSKIPNFSIIEWPNNVLYYMDERIIYALSDIRQKSGVPMFPSTVAGAHIRHEDSRSRHSTLNMSRLADATDFFCDWSGAMDVLQAIIQHPDIRGYGIYDNMKFGGAAGEKAMFHIDTRPRGDVCWWGQGREPVQYIYMQPSELRKYLKDFLKRRR